MLSLPIVFGALTASALVLGLVALWWSVRSTLAGAEEAALDVGEDSSERTALLETKRSLLRALKDLEHERSVGKLDEADYQRLSATYRARAKEVLAQLDQDLGVYLAQARALTGASEVAGRPYAKKVEIEPENKPSKKKKAKPIEADLSKDEASKDEASNASKADASNDEGEDESEEAEAERSPSDAAAMLASLPEDKRKEAEAFLAKLAAEAQKKSPKSEDEA